MKRWKILGIIQLICYIILLITNIIGIKKISSGLILKPVKDDYKNEILYYVDTKNHKDYIMKNNTLYYTEE
ncbi:MAG: hypothetical protein MSA15_05440 [Clostridium sp.]|nr:hypothetical protein [Clostridium sp.]